MTFKEFYNNVQNHEVLMGAGVLEDCEQFNEPSVVITNKVSPALKTQITLKAILNNKWEDLEDICLGKREPGVISSISRVVGYYSNMRQWNKSKLGERDDRMKGTYAIAS